MAHSDPAKRREYQNLYYKTAAWAEKRAQASKRWRDRSRLRILERDNFTCYYCGLRETVDLKKMHIDHKIPRDLGGSSDDDNLVTACSKCNQSKFNRPICESCHSWERPLRISQTEIRCVKCGAINSFPPGTIALDPEMHRVPDWVNEDNDATTAEC